MTDSVNISPNHTGKPLENARTFRYAAHSPGYVWDSDADGALLTDVRDGLGAGPLAEFAYDSAASSGLDAVIDTGEAVVGGAPLARDVTTTVNLLDNTTNQVVYVGWSPSATDTVKVGLSGAFNAEDPRIQIHEFDTDAGAISAHRNLRAIGPALHIENDRYETNDGSGAAVDNADSANTVGGVSPSQFARSDQNDTLSGAYAFTAQGASEQSVGTGSGEVNRFAGTASDLTVQVQGGHGRMAYAWNAYYDDGQGRWESIVANEPHALLSFIGHDPGPGVGNATLIFGTAPGNANAGDAVTWQLVTVDNNGNLDLHGKEFVGARIENRSNRPSSPSTGRFIYRTDKD